MANTPIDFLLAGSDCVLDTLYVDLHAPLPTHLPPHDVAFLAVGESAQNAPLLGRLGAALAAWPGAVVNGAPATILDLTRDRSAERLAGMPGVLSPPTLRLTRQEAFTAALSYPLIIRPIGSHAGAELERIADAESLAGYLDASTAPAVFISPFIDYSSADGLFRKLRVALIDGAPFIVHMAVSQHWMVHYLNAGMAEDDARRAEEAAAMAAFDSGFAARHRAALTSLCDRIPLDYFAIDCAETADGDLLIFEVDTAMIVHDMDPPEIYPYKGPAMRRLFDAFLAMLQRRAA